MSYQNANAVVQKFVNNYGNTGRTYNVIDFVLAVNAASPVYLDEEDFQRVGGKLRTVRLNYFPILCDGEGSCDANICDAGIVVEPAQEDFQITKCTATPLYAIPKDAIRQIDYNTWDFTGVALSIINSKLPDLRKSLATDMLTYLYVLAGRHVDGSAYGKRIVMANTNTGIVNPIGKWDIEKEYMDGGFNSPYILGGGEVLYWQKMVETGGLNAGGQLINKGDTNNTWYDQGLSDLILNDVVNGNHILSIAPEAFKFVTFLENAGIFRTDQDNIRDLDMLYKDAAGGVMNGTFVDPMTQIAWDLDVHYDTCAKKWKFQLKLHWDFFVMPATACNVQGVNGIMHYRTCPATQPLCPTGSPVTSPAAATTYSMTPASEGVTYPFTLFQATIGGVSSMPNAAITNIATLVAAMNDAYGQHIFVVSGSNVHYSGYAPISGSFNDGAIDFTFA